MKFEQVCQSGLMYFQQHRIFKILLPVSMPLMLVCVVLFLLQNLVSLGSFVSAIVFFGFILMLILTIAQCNFRMASIGLAGFALNYLISFVVSLIRYHHVAYGTLVYLVVYGGLAFLSYRKSITFN